MLPIITKRLSINRSIPIDIKQVYLDTADDTSIIFTNPNLKDFKNYIKLILNPYK